MTAGYRVWCDICGAEYDERDPAVRFIGGVWECNEESACFDRKAMNSLNGQALTEVRPDDDRG